MSWLATRCMYAAGVSDCAVAGTAANTNARKERAAALSARTGPPWDERWRTVVIVVLLRKFARGPAPERPAALTFSMRTRLSQSLAAARTKPPPVAIEALQNANIRAAS